MEKLYEEIVFKNGSSPALNQTNLNSMSKAINDIDDRVIEGFASAIIAGQSATAAQASATAAAASATSASNSSTSAQKSAASASASAASAALHNYAPDNETIEVVDTVTYTYNKSDILVNDHISINQTILDDFNTNSADNIIHVEIVDSTNTVKFNTQSACIYNVAGSSIMAKNTTSSTKDDFKISNISALTYFLTGTSADFDIKIWFTLKAGKLKAKTSTATSLGIVKPDGETIGIKEDGTIYLAIDDAESEAY